MGSQQKSIRAVAIVIKNDEVLLIFRKNDGKQYYVFPGGGVEKDETVEEAVTRELKEETSMEVKIEKLLYHHIYNNPDSEQFFYLCKYISGDPKLDENSPESKRNCENDYYEPAWFKIDELSKILVYPLEIRDWFIEDFKNNFVDTPKEATIKYSDRRQ